MVAQRILRRGALAAAGLAAAGLALAAAAPAGARVTTLRLVGHHESTAIVDAAPVQTAPDAPLSPGDGVIITERFTRGGRTVGHGRLTFVTTDFPFGVFVAGIELPGGHVTIADAASLNGRTQTFAIVGGTGRYAGARGFVVDRTVSETTDNDTFQIVT